MSFFYYDFHFLIFHFLQVFINYVYYEFSCVLQDYI